MIEIDAMFPVIVTSDIEALKHFYEKVFGFNAVFYEPGFYLHMVSDSGVQLGFLVPGHPSQPQFLQTLMPGDGYILSLEVKDAVKAYAEAQRMQLDVILELKQEDWGQLHFILRDPAGIGVDVVEHMEGAGE